MKSKLKLLFLFLLPFFALLALTSCQEEVVEITDPNQEESLIASDSSLATAMRSTSTVDGFRDNIIDGSNCISVNLPVTIIVNDITITINTYDDLELIEDIFEEFENDDDLLEILFPITIVLNDHTEVVINNQEELNIFIEECTEEPEVIDCIDFQYPISFALYNTDFQVIETVVIENDRELYEFLERLENGTTASGGVILASLNFPVTMVYADGSTVEVYNNQELEHVIHEAKEDCNSPRDCTEEFVDAALMDCSWNIYRYNGDDHFNDYNVFFNENGELNIISVHATVAITGVWSTSLSDEGVILNISELSEFDEDLEGNWVIVECNDDDRFELVRRNDNAGTNNTHMVIKKQCEDDLPCTAQEVHRYLKECIWYSGSNLLGNDLYGPYNFKEDGHVIIGNPNGTESINGTWDVELTDVGVIVVIELPEPYSHISLRWKVSECSEDRIKMFSGDNYLVFEKDCNAVVDPTIEEVEAILEECLWRIARLNIQGVDDYEAQYIGTPLKFEPNGVVKLRINGEFVSGTWDIIPTGVGLVLQMTFDGRPELNLYWLITVLENDLIKLENENSQMIIKRHCPEADNDIGYINNILFGGEWEVAVYEDGDVNETENYFMYVVDFLQNGWVKVTDPNNGIIDGSWLVYRNDGYLNLGLNFGIEPPFDELNHRWKIVDVSENRIELKDLSSNGTIERILVFEKL
mgnify:CR=1 FL=1